ncbi:MAG TPA: MetS family NSS transporter small subunit [Ignavibacteria bacterium]|nr:MetS family NSS transporter small subunit [Ignavibacteria bacterium]
MSLISIITMVLILGVVWGGFTFFLFKAMSFEKLKNKNKNKN